MWGLYIYYYENYRGKEFEPFIFTTDIMYNNKNIGNITMVIDCFLRYDKKNNLKKSKMSEILVDMNDI